LDYVLEGGVTESQEFYESLRDEYTGPGGAVRSLGDHDRALAWLEKLYEQRGAGMRTLKVNEEWDPLRGDPRFQDLQRRAAREARLA
jgi:hypothetical protein